MATGMIKHVAWHVACAPTSVQSLPMQGQHQQAEKVKTCFTLNAEWSFAYDLKFGLYEWDREDPAGKRTLREGAKVRSNHDTTLTKGPTLFVCKAHALAHADLLCLLPWACMFGESPPCVLSAR